MRVYLAGAVNLDEAFVRGWRNYAISVLSEDGIRCLDPIADKDIHPNYDPKDIIETDLKMIAQSNVILAEYSHPTYSYIGTSMEIRDAYLQGKVIVIWGNAHAGHYWLRYHASRYFGELDNALNYIRSLKARTAE